MRRVEDVEIAPVRSGALLDDARALVGAYADWVQAQPGFAGALDARGIGQEVAELPGQYAPPSGRLLLALVDGVAAGCVALRPLTDTIGEVKRLFVAPGYRGHSLGGRLLDALVEEAVEAGFASLRLDTLPFMHSAVRHYQRMGFVEIAAYVREPLPGARYFELALPAPRPKARMVTYHPDLAADFERLNRAWLEEFFRVEEKDERVFRDPGTEILAPGGEIFFVCEGDQVVGSCAVACHGDGTWELAKMAVDRAARGQGYGEWLVRTAIAFARERGARRFFLLSDEVLRDALRLYERTGFRRVAFPGSTGYQRGDVMMEYPL